MIFLWWWPLTYQIKIYSKMHRESMKVTVMSRWPLYKGDRYDRFDCSMSLISRIEEDLISMAMLGAAWYDHSRPSRDSSCISFTISKVNLKTISYRRNPWNTIWSHCLNKFKENHKRDGGYFIYYHMVPTHSFQRKKSH